MIVKRDRAALCTGINTTENVLLWKQVNRVQIKYFTTLGWWQTSRNDQHGVGKKKTYIWRIYRSSYFMVMVAVMMAWVGSVLYVPVTSIYPVEKGWRQPDSKTANQMSCDNCKVGTQRPGWNRSGRKAFPQKDRSSTQNQRVSLGGKRQTYLVCNRKLLCETSEVILLLYSSLVRHQAWVQHLGLGMFQECC